MRQLISSGLLGPEPTAASSSPVSAPVSFPVVEIHPNQARRCCTHNSAQVRQLYRSRTDRLREIARHYAALAELYDEEADGIDEDFDME